MKYLIALVIVVILRFGGMVGAWENPVCSEVVYTKQEINLTDVYPVVKIKVTTRVWIRIPTYKLPYLAWKRISSDILSHEEIYRAAQRDFEDAMKVVEERDSATKKLCEGGKP